jgi:hypothetical protein
MYNILHLATSRGMRDARRPHPVVQPPGLSHLTLIVRDEQRAPVRGSHPRPESPPPPPEPCPSSG